MSPKGAVMICGHGSRDERAVSQFNNMVEQMKHTHFADYDVESGFLEFAHPILLRAARYAVCRRSCQK
jgi:sirohydrochlorin cobaltochelatase